MEMALLHVSIGAASYLAIGVFFWLLLNIWLLRGKARTQLTVRDYFEVTGIIIFFWFPYFFMALVRNFR